MGADAIAALAISAIAAIVKAAQDAENKSAEAQAQLAAALQSAISLLSDAQAQVTSDMAARDAATLARLQAVADHPAVAGDSQLSQDMAAVVSELKARWSTPLPPGQLVKDPAP